MSSITGLTAKQVWVLKQISEHVATVTLQRLVVLGAADSYHGIGQTASSLVRRGALDRVGKHGSIGYRLTTHGRTLLQREKDVSNGSPQG